MSIEDPRLSNIDTTSASDEFDTAVEQHLGFAGEAVEGIEVAQAETPDSGRTDRVPAQPPVQTVAATIPSEVTPDADNVVTLPAGIELDNLEFEVDGENLILVLADGTEIVVIGGAANIPTFVLGDVVLPQVALFAALEGSNINVAAGPDGTFSAQSTPSNSRDFEDEEIGDGLEEFALAGLLDGTDQDNLQTASSAGGGNIGPIAGDLGSFGYDEAVLVTEGTADDVFTGVLTFRQGTAFAAITGVSLIGLGAPTLAGNVAEPGDTATPYGLTYGGQGLTIVTNTVAADSPEPRFIAIEAYGADLDNVGGRDLVFRLTITNRTTGAFEFQLFKPLDHADLNETDASDLLRLAFSYTVTDLTGREATGFFDIDIADDGATISVPGTVVNGEFQPVVGVVEEEQREVDGRGNEDTDGDLDGDEFGKELEPEARSDRPGFQDKTTHIATGGLGISWGADNLDFNDELDVNTLAGLGNRTVSFVIPQVSGSEGEGSEGELAARSVVSELTSNGYTVVYEYSEDGKTLTAYRIAITEKGTFYVNDEGNFVFGEALGSARVFEVVLDDNGSGSYTFTLFGTLDHDGAEEGAEEDALQLDFQFTATDSDGDTTAPATFSVRVIDDVLKLGDPERETVDEDGRPGLESGAGNSGPRDSGDSNGGTSERGDLNIRWGADDGNSVRNGGFTEQKGDRAVVFGANVAPEGLTSNGFGLFYAFNEARTELVAYRVDSEGYFIDANGDRIPAARSEEPSLLVSEEGSDKFLRLVDGEMPSVEPRLLSDAAVFEVTVSDTGSGSYKFTLLDNLDHSSPGEDNLYLDFNFTAYDGDGDSKFSSFTVVVDDDTPVFRKSPEDETVAERWIGERRSSQDGNLRISWGADDANSDEDGGVAEGKGDRYVVFREQNAPENLTSNGLGLAYVYGANGTALVAYRVNGLGQLVDGEGRVIFGRDGAVTIQDGELSANAGEMARGAAVFAVSLSDTDSGSYSFTLLDNLDHVGEGRGKEIDLKFKFQAVDSDGDVLNGSFEVEVRDGGPKLGDGVLSSVVDEEGVAGRSGNAGDSYTGNEGAAADAEGTSTSTPNVSLNINWGEDADLKSEALTNGEIGNVDDPIGRQVVFAAVEGGIALPVGVIANVGAVLGSDFASLTSGTQSLSYRIDYLVSDGHWNGGYVMTASVGESVVFKVTLDPSDAGSYKFELLGVLDHPGINAEDNIDLTFRFRGIDSDGDETAVGTFTVTVDDDSATARNDSVTIAEDPVLPATGNLISNDTVGADGAVVHQVKLPGSSSFEDLTTGTAVQGGGYSFAVAGKGTYVFKPNGEWSFTPLANFNGDASFEYKLRDGDGDVSNAATVNVTVTPVNDIPVGNDDAFNVTEAQIEGALIDSKYLVGNVLANDTDVDNDPLLNASPRQTLVAAVNTVSINNGTNTGLDLVLSGSTDGVYKISGTYGDVYLKVEANGDINMWTDSGEDPFKALGITESATITIGYTVSDSQNPALTDTATAVITVNGTNDNPTAVNDSFLGAGGGSFSDNFNAGNVNGWTAVKLGNRTNTNEGEWTFANGVVTEKENEADAFLKAPTNALPSGAASSTVYRIEVDADPQNDNARVEPRNEAVGLVFGFVDNQNFYRAYWKSYDHNSRNAQDYRDLVLERVVNGQVTILSKIDNVNLGNDMMKFILSVGPGGIRVEVSGSFTTQVLTSTERPALGGYGLYSEDNDDGITYDNFSITVGGAITTAEDTALTIQAVDLLANDSDVDGDAFEIVSVGGNSTTGTSANGGVVSLVNGVITYTPAANYHGPDTFTYTISDNNGGTSTATVTVNVTPVNDPTSIVSLVPRVSYTEIDGLNDVLPGPDAQKPFTSLYFGVPFQDGLTLEDVDSSGWTKITFTLSNAFAGDGLQLSNEDLPSGLQGKIVETGEGTTQLVISAASGQLFTESDIRTLINELRFFVSEKTPANSPTRFLVVTLTDNGDGTNPPVDSAFQVQIGVTGVNDTPTDLLNNSVSVTTTEDTGISDLTSAMRTAFGAPWGPYNFVDLDEDSSDFNGSAARMTLTVDHGTLQFTGGPGLWLVSGYDTAELVIEGTVAALNEFINGRGFANLAYRPNANFAGSDTLSFKISDQGDQGMDAKESEIRTVTINVTADADAPSLSVSAASGDEDTPISLNLTAALTDTDGSETLTLEILDIPVGAVLTAGPGQTFTATSGNTVANITSWDLSQLKITPPSNSNVDFTLQVRATSTETGGVDTEVVSQSLLVNVSPVNDKPVLSVGDTTIDGASGAPLYLRDLPQWSASDPDQGDATKIMTVTLTLTVPQGVGSLNANWGGVDGSINISGAGPNAAMGEFTTLTIVANGDASKGLDGYDVLNAFLKAQGFDPVNNQIGVAFYPAANFSGNVTLSYTLSDNGGNGGAALQDTGSLTISVAGPTNQVPADIIWNGVEPQSSAVNAGVIANLSVVDPDNTGGYVYSLLNGSSDRFTVSDSGVVRAVSTLAQNATYTLIVQVRDGLGGIRVETFNVITGDGGNNTVPSTGQNATILVGDDIIYGDGNNDTLYGGDDDDTLYGQSSGDSLYGGVGRDSLYGGSSNDTLYGDQDDRVLDGGEGNDDTLVIQSNFTSVSDAQINLIEEIELTAAVTMDLSNQTEGFDIEGSSGADLITGGSGNDDIDGNGGNDTIRGGGGNDDILGDEGNDTLYGDAGEDELSGGEGNDTLHGGADGDELSGGNGNDTLYGDEGDTSLNGGNGTDTLIIDRNFTAASDSQVSSIEKIEMTGSARTLNLSNQDDEGFSVSIFADNDGNTKNYDVTFRQNNGERDEIIFEHLNVGNLHNTAVTVRNFEVSNDKVRIINDLQGSTGGFTRVTSTDANLSGIGNNGVIEIVNAHTAASLTDDGLGRSVHNLIVNAIGQINAGQYTVIVYSGMSGTVHAGIYSIHVDSTGNLIVANSEIEHVMTINNVGYDGLRAENFTGVTDPIILDLDKNGFAFSSIDNGVSFDINADGNKDQIAWTKDDGILAYDVDGNGVIDNGSEIFTPDFNGGKFASGVAALASLDSNGDGKIDAGDAAFKDLKIWLDADNDGVSDEGELSSLIDNGVTSIALTTDQSGGSEDGQVIFAEGEFTFADGTTGNFVEVGFDTIFGSEPEGVTLRGGMGEVVMTGTDRADTFVFDETALDELDVADVITDFSTAEGDVLDVTALLDSLLGEQPDATVDTLLRATLDGAGNTTVSVQAEPGVWKDVVELQNHDTAIKVLFEDKHTTIIPHD